MATFTASAAQAGVIALSNVNGTITRVVKYAHTVALSAGDVIQMVRVPAGAIVSRVQPAVSVSAGVITANLGDGNDTSAYAAAAVLSGTGADVALQYRGLGRSYSAEDTIDIVITALSAVPGTCKLALAVDYTLHNGG